MLTGAILEEPVAIFVAFLIVLTGQISYFRDISLITVIIIFGVVQIVYVIILVRKIIKLLHFSVIT
jgi:hypothetical protein